MLLGGLLFYEEKQSNGEVGVWKEKREESLGLGCIIWEKIRFFFKKINIEEIRRVFYIFSAFWRILLLY